MRRIIKFTVPMIAFAAMIFTGCQNEPAPSQPFQSQIKVEPPKITIPIGATIDSAIFNINVTTALNEEVTIHRITADWEESDVTWNNFAGSFNSSVEGSFTPTGSGWYSTDITSLFTGWIDSSYTNYGILLKEETPAQFQFYKSRESGMSPYLKIYWTLNGTSGSDSSDAYADSYINSNQGDENFGDSTKLITGWQDTEEVQSLIRFDIELEPNYTNCTHSFGFWKTHSAYGPAPYDTVWALLGEDSTFFLSGKTNYEVLWTPPRGGNAYYILAHQYIATDLNFLSGADPSEVQEAFDNATNLFNTYTPEDIKGLKGNDPVRQQFIALNDSLSQYNGGIIGPGSCGENSQLYPFKAK